MSQSQLNALASLGLSVLNQGGISHLLELGGPPGVAFGVVPPIGMLSTGTGEGCHLLSLGDCLGAGVGGATGLCCSSTGEVLHGRESGGDRDVCPNKMW